MLFIDGFEQFSNKDRPESLIRMAGYIVAGSANLVAGHKANSKSIELLRSSLSRDWPIAGDTLSIGFALNFAERGGVISVSGGGGSIGCFIDSETGLFNLGNEVGYVIPIKNNWYYIELVIDKVLQTGSIYVNGKLDVTEALPVAMSSASDLTIKLNPYELVSGDYGKKMFDDLYINDGDKLGPIQVTTRLPTNDQLKQWNVAGATTHSKAVGVLPPEMLDRYIHASGDGLADSFTSSTGLPDNNPVIKMGTITLIRKGTADPLSVDVNINEQVQTLSNIGRDWAYRYTTADGVGYNNASVVASEFGVKIKL